MNESNYTLWGKHEEANYEQINFRIPYGESFKFFYPYFTSSCSLKFSDCIIVR